MGKHTQRKPGYLPKVAAGAAPLALLLAGPASALADPTLPLDGLPLDLQQHDGLDHSVHSTAASVDAARTTHGLPVPAGSSLQQAVSDTAGYGLSDSLTAVKTANGSAPSPQYVRVGSPVQLESSRFGSASPGGSGLDGSVHEGAWRPYGVDGVTDAFAGADAGFGSGRFAGDLRGGAGAHRSSGHAVDFGGPDPAAESEQRGMGQFAGSLDVSHLEVPASDVGRHLGAADVGPVSGFLLTTQSLAGNGFRGDVASRRVSAFGVPDAVLSTPPLG